MKHLLEVIALSVKNIGTLTQMRRVTNANLLSYLTKALIEHVLLENIPIKPPTY